MTDVDDAKLLLTLANSQIVAAKEAIATAQTQLLAGLTKLAAIVPPPPPVPAYKAPTTPFEFAAVGTGYSLLYDWAFGTAGNVRNYDELAKDWQSVDNFGTVSNGGGQYGAVTAAFPSESPAYITQFSLPDGSFTQPIDNDPAKPLRQFTNSSIILHARSLRKVLQTLDGTMYAAGTAGPAYAHAGVCGSITSKRTLPSGGKDYGKDVVWETRLRMLNAPTAYWIAVWTCGGKWHNGPEMDVMEGYWGEKESGLRDGKLFHVNSVGGVDQSFLPADSWWRGIEKSKMPTAAVPMTNWHTYTWVYRKDNTYSVYIDGYKFQDGTLIWRYEGKPDGEVVPMWFLLDATLGKTVVWPGSKAEVPASELPFSVEVAFSRVWQR